ncbi:34496_t:CDS:1, partial [Racocetra persica]
AQVNILRYNTTYQNTHASAQSNKISSNKKQSKLTLINTTNTNMQVPESPST